MPWIIDYPIVLERLTGQGLVSLYPNGGAFGFADDEGVRHVCWAGGDDPSIRPEARDWVRQAPRPFEVNLSSLAIEAWQKRLPGGAWVMPLSHWAYELEYGNAGWLPELIERLGVDPGLLITRNSAAAIEFAVHEVEPFGLMVRGLLEMLSGSDFLLAFPGWPVVCTVHHHKQLWWSTPDPELLESLERMLGRSSGQAAVGKGDRG